MNSAEQRISDMESKISLLENLIKDGLAKQAAASKENDEKIAITAKRLEELETDTARYIDHHGEHHSKDSVSEMEMNRMTIAAFYKTHPEVRADLLKMQSITGVPKADSDDPQP